MELLTTFFSQDNTARHLAVLGVALVVALVAFWLTRALLTTVSRKVALKTRFKWDDLVVEAGVFGRLALAAPALVAALAADLIAPWGGVLSRASNVLLLIAALGFMDKALTALVSIYQQRPVSARRPIKGPIQLVKIFLYVIGTLAVVGFALGRSPWGLLSGIGAFTAVLMLVFRDTILSFVAGMQIVTGDLIRKGDWLEVPAFGADGDVIDIALYTVRVQNWDKTIVAIPTFKLMDGGFKNWRGMSESGGRRIKRALIIDQTSVAFASEALLSSLDKIQGLKPYLDSKVQDIATDNKQHGADPAHPLNGRHLTNLGCFRAYVKHFLENHSLINQGMTLIVRQLAPTKEGLPLQIYCFTKTTDWAAYEGVQSDIFDHLLAALPWFGLKAYQRSLGLDNRIPEELKA